MVNSNIYKCAFLNIKGQTGLKLDKQQQIESLVIKYKVDAIHLQEVNIDEESFSDCDFLMSNYNILPHNSVNKYGTATLIRSELSPENFRCDTDGRVQIYDLGNITFANIYFHSGTDGISRNEREKLCSEVLPNLLTNSKNSGYIGGDFNCIIDKKDATNNPEQKMS